MYQRFYDYVRPLTTVPDALLREALGRMTLRTFSSGTVLIRQGEVPHTCYFVMEGLVRQSALDEDGQEQTLRFCSDFQAVAAFGGESPWSFECAGNCLLLVGNLSEEDSLMQEFPFLSAIVRRVLELSVSREQQQHAAFISRTPEARYAAFTEAFPDLQGRIRQKDLASYLGITPEALSRLKQRVRHRQP